jgi:hypothetical protein
VGIFFLWRVKFVVRLKLRLSLFFPEVFHGILKVLNFFPELIFLVSGDKFELVLLFFNRMSEHVEFLPILINTLVERIFLNFIDYGRNIGLNVLPHVKNFL